jgi:hypothetical protein
MKVILRLAILVAAFLLVTNIAFAQCDIDVLCYEIIATPEIGYGDPDGDVWEVCLNFDGKGNGYSRKYDYSVDLYLFGGGPGWFNTGGIPTIGGNPIWSTWILHGEDESGFLQPIGDAYMLTGEGEREGTRYTVQGKRVPCMQAAPN